MPINKDDENQQSSKPTPQAEPTKVFGEDFARAAGAQQPSNTQGAPVSESTRSSARPSQRGGLTAAIQRATGNASRRRPGADLQKVEESFSKMLNTSNFRTYENSEYQVVALGPDRLNLNLSVLLVSLPITGPDGSQHTSVYTLLIDDGQPLADHVIQVGPQSFRYTTVVGEAFTQELWGRISAYLQQTAGRQLALHNAGNMVLPADFDVVDQDLVYRCSFFISEALFRLTEQDVFGSIDDVVSISDIGESDQLQTKIDFSDVNGITATGLPLRQDLRITLNLNQLNAGNNNAMSAFQKDNAMVVSDVAAYIDLSYREPEAPLWGQQPSTQYYTPRMVITRLDTGLPMITPEVQMLGLIVGTLPSKKLLWARTWSNNIRDRSRGSKDTYLRDIGAIGYDISPNGEAAKIPTDSESFDDASLAKLIMATVRDDLVISMDIEENGELTWLNHTFLDAAENIAGAEDSLIATADNLTGGLFSNLWNSVPVDERFIVVDDYNRIALGYYTNSAGVREDLRGLDYLAVLNLYGDRNDGLPAKFQATYDNLDDEPAIRLAVREELIKKILPSAVITGYARRVNINPVFLDVLVAAASQAGLKIKPDGAQLGFGNRQVRGRAGFDRLGMRDARNVGSMFQAAGNTGGAVRGGFNQPMMGRFHRTR